MERFSALIGFVLILAIAIGLSNNRRAIRWRTVMWGLILQILTAIAVLKGELIAQWLSAIALPILPQQAYDNLENLRSLYPDIYTSDGGFYDAVNPTTTKVGHRRLVLDQSMIMAGIDDAVNDGALQKRFAADPISWAAKLYLSIEHMSIH